MQICGSWLEGVGGWRLKLRCDSGVKLWGCRGKRAGGDRAAGCRVNKLRDPLKKLRCEGVYGAKHCRGEGASFSVLRYSLYLSEKYDSMLRWDVSEHVNSVTCVFTLQGSCSFVMLWGRTVVLPPKRQQHPARNITFYLFHECYVLFGNLLPLELQRRHVWDNPETKRQTSALRGPSSGTLMTTIPIVTLPDATELGAVVMAIYDVVQDLQHQLPQLAVLHQGDGEERIQEGGRQSGRHGLGLEARRHLRREVTKSWGTTSQRTVIKQKHLCWAERLRSQTVRMLTFSAMSGLGSGGHHFVCWM